MSCRSMSPNAVGSLKIVRGGVHPRQGAKLPRAWLNWAHDAVIGGCCQTKANQFHFSSNLNPLGYAKTAPLGKSGGAVQLEI
jgi:hypothetical protein